MIHLKRKAMFACAALLVGFGAAHAQGAPSRDDGADCHRQIAKISEALTQNQIGANQTALGIESFKEQARLQRTAAEASRNRRDYSAASEAEALADKLEADSDMLARSMRPIQQQGAQLLSMRQSLMRTCR